MGKIWANSGDSHLVEPADIFTSSMPAGLAERMPRSVKDPDGRAETIYVDGYEFRRSIPRSSLVDPETGQTMDERAPGSNDPRLRLKDLDQEGIWAELIYPSIGIWASSIRDPQLLAAGTRAINDWAIGFQDVSPRYVCAASVPLLDINDAVGEIERVAGSGVQSRVLPCGTARRQGLERHELGTDMDRARRHPDRSRLSTSGPNRTTRLPATVSTIAAQGAPCSTTSKPPTEANAPPPRWWLPASLTGIPTSRSSCQRAAPPGGRSSPTASTRLTASTPRPSGRD